jgi:hypothetical protein
MHRARSAWPRAFDSLPSQDPNPGRCQSYTVELTGTKLAHQARAAVVRGIS